MLSRYCCFGIKIGPQETQNDKNESPIPRPISAFKAILCPLLQVATASLLPASVLTSAIQSQGPSHLEQPLKGRVRIGGAHSLLSTPIPTSSQLLTPTHTLSYLSVFTHTCSHLLTFTHSCSYPLKPAHTVTPVHSLLSHTQPHQLIPTLDISLPLIPAHTHSLPLTPAPLFTPLHTCSLPPQPVLQQQVPGNHIQEKWSHKHSEGHCQPLELGG